MVVFNKTIIPLVLVGYEMIIANSALRASLAIYHLISIRACGIIVKYNLHNAHLNTKFSKLPEEEGLLNEG